MGSGCKFSIDSINDWLIDFHLVKNQYRTSEKIIGLAQRPPEVDINISCQVTDHMHSSSTISGFSNLNP